MNTRPELNGDVEHCLVLLSIWSANWRGDQLSYQTGRTLGHQHASGSGAHRSRLAIVFGLTLAYLIAEIVGAYLTNSLALLADAAHMATDCGGIGLALFAIWFAERPAHPGKSYGYYRVEVLAALINGAVLLAVGFYVVWEAWKRFSEPPEVGGGGMILIAGLGLAVNLVGIVLLRKGAGRESQCSGGVP